MGRFGQADIPAPLSWAGAPARSRLRSPGRPRLSRPKRRRVLVLGLPPQGGHSSSVLTQRIAFIESEAAAIVNQLMMTDRNTLLGQHYFQGYFQFKQIAAGNVPDLGDGVCSIGEITSGARDCAGAGAFATRGAFSKTTSQASVLLASPQAELDWQGDGNLALYDTTVAPRKVIWSSDTSAATNASGAAGTRLALGSDFAKTTTTALTTSAGRRC